MKYLFLIIRHFFPRRKWEYIGCNPVWSSSSSHRPCGIIITQRDQFGNLRTFKVKS